MKFRLVEFLNPNIPYMLRNDGKLFEVKNKLTKGEITFHPYLLDKELYDQDRLTLYDLQYNIFCGPGLDALYWYYMHTKDSEAKQEIDLILSAIVSHDSALKSKVVDNFDIKPDFSLNNAEIVLRYKNLNDAFNQEFCRVRFSGKYRPGYSSSIWFRISSVRFNWFDLIWKVVYDNKNSIETVNICTDPQALLKEAFYKIGEKEIKNFPVEDFIMLKGNPVVESKSNVENNFRQGKCFYESLKCNTYYQHFNYNVLKNSEEYIM